MPVMRIIVAGPPKTGNIWIKCLLAQVYNLNILYSPPRTDADFSQAVADGWFPDGSIFHQHYGPTGHFLETAAALDIKLVTIIRNPYDTFVSLYHFVQNFPKQFAHPPNPLHRIFGKPIDHPDVYAYIGDKAGGFGIHLLSAINWMESGRSIIVRYEDLKTSPIQVLREVSAGIEAAGEPTLQSAIKKCTAQNMRKLFSRYRKHIRKGESGDWRNNLNAGHLGAMAAHSAWIEKLGYEVFQPEQLKS